MMVRAHIGLLAAVLIAGSATTQVRRLDRGLDFDTFLPPAKPAEVGIDAAALDRWIRASGKSGTDAIILLRDGKVVCERYTKRGRKPIHLMSVTKLFTWAAIGCLIAEGKIASVDAPLSTWFDDWTEGLAGKVTLRHVLSHTSGLKHLGSAYRLNSQKDRVAFARSSPVVDEPGTKVAYNNRAIALLSGVVQAASGKPLDEYLNEKLLEPLGCAGFWQRDGAGSPVAYAELGLRARDLAKFGQLILQRGVWNGARLLGADWIADSVEPSEKTAGLGLGWFRRLDGKREQVGGGIYHTGWLGQYLAVYPEWGVVAVRLTAGKMDWSKGQMDASATRFAGFFTQLESCIADREPRTPRVVKIAVAKPAARARPTGKPVAPERWEGTWHLKIERGNMHPTPVHGRLTVEARGTALAGKLSFYELAGWVGLELTGVERAGTSLHFGAENTLFRQLRTRLRLELAADGAQGDGRIVSGRHFEIGEPEFPWSVTATRLAQRAETPEHDLRTACASSDTDAMILTQRGKKICEILDVRDPIALGRLSRVVTWLALGNLAHREGAATDPAADPAWSAKTPLDEYAEKHLFAPLGIGRFTWSAEAGFALAARDLHKLACLVRDDGVWRGKRLVAAGWTTKAREASERDRQNALFWRWNSVDGGRALGAGIWAKGTPGNYLFACPKLGVAAIRLTRGAAVERGEHNAWTVRLDSLPALIERAIAK